jgi:tetratricopeptide (TPR) repeat protein
LEKPRPHRRPASHQRISAAARARLTDCLGAIDNGRRELAVSLARELAADQEPTTRFVGARLLYLLRCYPEALASLEEHLSSFPEDAYGRRLHFAMLNRLGFDQEAGVALRALLRTADDPKVHHAAAMYFQSMGRADIALQHLERVLERNRSDAGSCRLQLDIAVKAGDSATARAAAERALDLEPERWREIVDRSLEIGLYDLAEREARNRGDLPEGRAILALLAAYRGEWNEAVDLASAALQADPGCAHAVTARVAAAVSRGDLETAEREIERFRGRPSLALRTWRAELLRRRHEYERARDILTGVQNDFSDYLAAKLVSILVKGAIEDQEWVTSTAYDGVLEGQLEALGIELAMENDRVRETELRAAAGEALARMAGNLSPFPSVPRNGELHRIQIPKAPRARARDAQHLAGWLGVEEAEKITAAEIERIGPHPIAECYRAELSLWSGAYQIAEARFEDILRKQRRTVWGWIGLGASQTLGGDPERGLASLDEGIREMGWRGATIPIYRGEALYRLGRLDEAAEELREAAESQPGRISAWVLRVLVEHERANAGERDRCFDHLDRNASALLCDAAGACGIDGWWPAAPTVETRFSVARKCLELMRGNRSSSCPLWFAPGSDTVRTVIYGRPVTSPQWEAREISALRDLS